ncbi:MAG: hypothetical protein ACM31L_14300 [Actinomycetota bacterium]
MNIRCCLALALVVALPAPSVLAQVSGADHADRMAAEIALKRAQIRAHAGCPASRIATPQELPATAAPTRRVGNYPTTGSAGAVPAPGVTACGR